MRQYIGARYVPRFSEVNGGNWSSDYAYEPLIIVKNGNDYYTSKKSVPVGIAITNTEYWAPTGNYNAAISHLQDQIDALSVRYDGYLLIGDSYLNGVGTTNPEGWGSHFKMIRGISSENYYRYASNGAGLVARGSGSKTFSDVVDDAIGGMTSSERQSIGHVIILGGYNDANYNSSYDDMMTAKNSLLTKLIQFYPNADYYIGVIGKDIAYTENGGDVRTRIRGRVIPAYSNSTPTSRKQFGYLSNLNLVLSSDLMANNNHPSDTGNAQIARALDAALRGEYRQGINNMTIDLSMFGATIGMYLYRDDRTSIAVLNQFDITIPADSGFTLNGSAVIGTYSGEIYPGTVQEVSIPVDMLIQLSTDTKFAQGRLCLDRSGNIILRVRLLDGGSWMSVPSGSRIVIYETTTYIPSSLLM